METSVVLRGSLPDGIPDCAVNRSRDADLAERLEAAGSIVVNGSRMTRVCNDKLLTYRLADDIGVPHLPVSVPGGPLPPGPPWVVKPRSGHGGEGVRLVEDVEGLEDAIARIGPSSLIQSACPVLGRDLRAYVLDGEVLAWVMRTGRGDFRANHGLGGSAELWEPDARQEGIVRSVSKALGPGFYGVDLLPTGDGAVLNEVEDAVGTRMLYELTDLDPARLLMASVHSKVSR